MTIRTYHRPVKTSEVVVVSLSQQEEEDRQKMAAGQGGKGSSASPPPKSGNGQYQQPPLPQSQQRQRSAGGPSSTVDASLQKYTGEQRILELNRRELEKASSGDTGDHVRCHLFHSSTFTTSLYFNFTTSRLHDFTSLYSSFISLTSGHNKPPTTPINLTIKYVSLYTPHRQLHLQPQVTTTN